MSDGGYNERLFTGKGLRPRLHNLRFDWVKNELSRDYEDKRYDLLEIGCFDGRLLDFIPEPRSYLGLDADSEGGFTSIPASKLDRENLSFVKSSHWQDLVGVADKSFDVCASLETIEHIPAEDVGEYIEQIARIVRKGLLFTVPNEKGPVFVAKRSVKWARGWYVQPYTSAEMMWASLGKLDRVKRDQHKGFDYRRLACELEPWFKVDLVQGMPFGAAPAWMGFTVGIRATVRD